MQQKGTRLNFSATTYLPFLLLLTAVIGLWIHRTVWIAALVAAVLAGIVTGALHWLTVVWIALLAALAIAYTRARDSTSPDKHIWQTLAGLAFAIYAIAMFIPVLPGFHRIVLVQPQVLSEGAAPYGISVGFPKVVTGIVILGLINPLLVTSWRELGRVLARAFPIYLIFTAVGMILVIAMGYSSFAPKWTALFLLFAPVNLFFTCLSEEAFFRGYIQHELSRIGSNRRLAAGVALTIASVLFGLAHFGGGWTYVFVAAVAGLGYGWAFMRTQRIEAAMAVHFGLNATHFLLFTYPRLG
ncbi:MAG TPA: type II CAAX endopeptidase family protein [Steroidobacteraceae bacterium]|nr:type II CAAX endopeptidase family protein [Steroidobacteraceae bacterium]